MILISADRNTHHFVCILSISTGSIDEADYEFRNGLFNYYISCAEYKEAAILLAGLNLDNTARPYTDFEKADIHVKCAESCLLGDEALDAEMYVKRASELMNSADHEDKSVAGALNLRYRVIYARVLDANRKFIDAASRYYDISTISNKDVSEDELLVLLGKSVTCAVLAKAGPPRTRILALLCKDPRISSLETLPSFSQHATVLRKMYTEQILPISELNEFEKSLLPHQKAITSEGYTVVEKAVIEHNLQAVSKIYDNIKMPELATLLSMDTSNAEKLVAKMITEERLQGYLDQTENLLVFSEVSDKMALWNNNIRNICKDVMDCLEVVNEQYPEKTR